MSEPKAKKEPSLQRQMMHGSAWTIGLRWCVRLTGLVSTIILARLLTPADYGIVSIATLIVGTIEIFSQTGQKAAIVRHPNPTREHYDAAWTISLILGLVLGLVVWAATPLTTAYFHEPRAKLVVEVLALRTMMLGFQNIGTINFLRNLQFQKQFQFTVWPSLISFVVTVASAFFLRNYWALVIGILSQQVANVVLSYTMEPYRPRISFTKIPEIWSYSIWLLIRTLGEYVITQVDLVAIGGFISSVAMGRFSMATDLATAPSQELNTPVTSVLFPVMARVQDDKKKRRELYLSVLNWSALICVSTSVGVALVASDMTDLILGAKWENVKPLIPWLALSFGLLGMTASVYSAFNTVGRQIVSARLTWMRVLGLTAAIFPVAYYYRSLEAVVIARFLVTVAITPTLFYALSKALEVPVRDFAVVIWRPVAAGLVMAAVVLAINAAIDFSGPFRLALDIAAGAAAFASSLMALWWAVGRPDGPEQIVTRQVRAWLPQLANRSKAFSPLVRPNDAASESKHDQPMV